MEEDQVEVADADDGSLVVVRLEVEAPMVAVGSLGA